MCFLCTTRKVLSECSLKPQKKKQKGEIESVQGVSFKATNTTKVYKITSRKRKKAMADPLPVPVSVVLLGLCAISVTCSVFCIRNLHKYTSRIKEMTTVCYLLGIWLVKLCAAFAIWGLRMAWTGSGGLTLREMIWYVPLSISLIVLTLVVLAYWFALVFCKEKTKSQPSFMQSHGWLLHWMNLKRVLLVLAFAYVPCIISSFLTLRGISDERLNAPMTAMYPSEVQYLLLFVYLYVTSLCFPVLYLLTQVAFEDAYGIRRTLIAAMTDCSFWVLVFYFGGLFQSVVNEEVDIGTLITGCFFTTQITWVYHLTWKARSVYNNARDTTFHSITVRPQDDTAVNQKNIELPKINTLAIAADEYPFPEVSGIYPPFESHPLWQLLMKPHSEEFLAFSSLCEKSFCSENLVAWKLLYKLLGEWKKDGPKDFFGEKTELKTKFIGVDAYWPLNMNSELLEEAQRWVMVDSRITPPDFSFPDGILNRLIAEVFQNLQQDMWIRFLKSKYQK